MDEHGENGSPERTADLQVARRLFVCAALAILMGAASVFAGTLSPSATPRAVAPIPPSGAPPKAAAVTPVEDPVAQALQDLPHEASTPGGLAVVRLLPKAPLTVRDRTRLRADVGARAPVVETIEPGEPLRVVGAVDVPGGAWLQVRRSNGEVAYVQAIVAADLGLWRAAQAEERQRRLEAEALAAQTASGIAVEPAPLPSDLMQGAPLSPTGRPN